MTQGTNTQSPLAAGSLRRNFSWTLAGNLVYAACQWGMLTSIAKLGTPLMVGQFALALAIATPVFTLTSLQLRSVQATDPTGRFLLNHYLTVRLLGTLLGFLSVVFVALISTDDATLSVAIAISLGKALDAIADVFYGFFQQNEEMDRIAKAMIFNGIGSIAAISGALWLTSNLVVAGLISSCVSLLTLVLVVLPSTRSMIKGAQRSHIRNLYDPDLGMAPKWDREKSVDLIWTAMPLGFVMLLASLNANVPRYFVGLYQGEAPLGIFAALAYAIVAGSTIVAALGNSASPRLAKFYALGNAKEFRSLLNKLMFMGFAIGIGGAILATLFGGWILEKLYTAEYAPFAGVLAVLALAGSFTFAGSFLGYGMTAALKYRAQMPVFGAVVLTTSLCCFLLIPSFGLSGAAWAMVAGGATQVALGMMVVRQALKELPDDN